MKPRLAFLLFKYFPFGGLQSDFLRIALECRKRGYAIVVYTRSWEGDIPEGFDVQLVPSRSATNHGKAARFTEYVQDELKKSPVDGVIGFNRMPGLDVYFSPDNCYAEKAKTQRGPFYRLSSRYRTYAAFEEAVFSQRSDTEILLISERQMTGYVNFYHTPESRLHLLPPGMDPSRRKPIDANEVRDELRATIGVGPDEKILIQVGSGFITKGLDRSIRALASLPDVLRGKTKLLVVGKDRPARFMKLARNLGVSERVEFLGGRDDVPHLLLAADLMIHPSVNEAAGIVLLEGLAAGLPIVCSAACGHAPYIERSGGGVVLAEPFEQGQLNSTLKRLLSEADLKRLGANGLAYAAETDLYSQHERAADIIEQTMGKRD